MATATEIGTNETQVDQWRFDCAVGMGFTPTQADEVVRHPEMDLHQLDRMIKAGCDHTLALEILRS